MRRSSESFVMLSVLAGLLALVLSPDGMAEQGDVSPSSSSQYPPSTGIVGAIGDAKITTRVRGKLLNDEQMAGSSINVTTRSGVVLLQGTVPSAEMAEEASEIARSVDGVKAVDNRLSTPVSIKRLAVRESTSPSTGSSSDEDGRINLSVRDNVLTDRELGNTRIGIDTVNGVVRLFGQVQTSDQRDEAIRVARKVKGVRGVDASSLIVSSSP